MTPLLYANSGEACTVEIQHRDNTRHMNEQGTSKLMTIYISINDYKHPAEF
jgi:hypothetical protein